MKRISETEMIKAIEAKTNYIAPEIDGRMMVVADAQLAADKKEVKEMTEELYKEVICPMCYRLNPQHATADNGIGCKSCEERQIIKKKWLDCPL